MRKNNDSLLATILGGAIFCFVFLGMAFIFTNNTKTMKGNTNSSNQGIVNNEEISLGDSIANCAEGGSGSSSCTNVWRTGTMVTVGVGTSAPSGCYSTLPNPNTTSSSTVYLNCHKDGVASQPGATVEDGPWYWQGTAYTKERVCTGTDTCVKCVEGYYLENSTTCTICPSGSACDGTSTVEVCPIGTYSDSKGKLACTLCTGKTYQDETGQTSCKICNGVVNGEHTACEPCNNPGQYVANNKCITCPSGYQATDTYPECHIVIPAGKYLVGGTTQIVSCPAGTYSTIGTWGYSGHCLSGNCAVGSANADGCTSCGSGKTSPVGSTSAEQCTDVIADDCSVTVTSSVVPDGLVSYNSIFTANISVSGSDCVGRTLTTSITNGSFSEGGTSREDNVSNGTKFNFIVKVKDMNVCRSTTTVTATLSKKTGETSVKKSSVTVKTTCEWQETPKWTDCESDANIDYTSRKAAEDAGADHYYIVKSNIDRCSSVGKKYVDYYVRPCCGGTTRKTPACYIKDDGSYTWTAYPEASWLKVEGVSKEADCKEEEQDACYLDPTGEYVWGKYAKTTGYTLITSITDSSLCKKPTPEEACYKNGDDYLWTSTPPEGYTKVEGVTKPEDCAPEETPACYLHGSEFVWGKYDRITGYIKLEDIESESECKRPEEDACYVDKDGNYVWGSYGDDPNYTLVPSITEMSQCKVDVPVPATGISISKLVYIFMAILMACGVGFIYYSSVVKKNN